MPDAITQIERADTAIIHGLADAGVPLSTMRRDARDRWPAGCGRSL